MKSYLVPFILFFLSVLFFAVGFLSINKNKPLVQFKKPDSYVKEISPTSVVQPRVQSMVQSTSSGVLSAKNIKIERSVQITKILDGDTVQTSTGEKIRYLGINAPETGQPFSAESKKENEKLVLGKKAGLEFDVVQKDKYGRTLAYVFINNQFVNLEMISQGLAVSETIQPNVKYQDEIVQAQIDARKNCLGIWQGLCSTENQKCIKIVSINANAVGDDNKNKNGEWVEIKNNCTSLTPMKDWLLKDNSASNKYSFKNFSLDAGKTVQLFSGCGKDQLDKLYWQCPETKYAIWNNSSDHAFLYNEKGELVDDYGY